MTDTGQISGLFAKRALSLLEGPTCGPRLSFEADEADETDEALLTGSPLLGLRESNWRKVVDATAARPAGRLMRVHILTGSNPDAWFLAGSSLSIPTVNTARTGLVRTSPLGVLSGGATYSTTLTSAGSLTASSRLTGAGILTASTTSVKQASATLAGVGSLNANAVQLAVGATLAGTSILSANTTSRQTPIEELRAEFLAALWGEFCYSPKEAEAVEASFTFEDIVPAKREYDWDIEGIDVDPLESPLPTVGAIPFVIDNPLIAQILTERAIARFEGEFGTVANAAVEDALTVVQRNDLGGTPLVMFSEDGILSLQWERDRYGVGLIFAGDRSVSVVFRRPGQFYAENGIEVPVDGDLPQSFNNTLVEIISLVPTKVND